MGPELCASPVRLAAGSARSSATPRTVAPRLIPRGPRRTPDPVSVFKVKGQPYEGYEESACRESKPPLPNDGVPPRRKDSQHDDGDKCERAIETGVHPAPGRSLGRMICWDAGAAMSQFFLAVVTSHHSRSSCSPCAIHIIMTSRSHGGPAMTSPTRTSMPINVVTNPTKSSLRGFAPLCARVK